MLWPSRIYKFCQRYDIINFCSASDPLKCQIIAELLPGPLLQLIVPA